MFQKPQSPKVLLGNPTSAFLITLNFFGTYEINEHITEPFENNNKNIGDRTITTDKHEKVTINTLDAKPLTDRCFWIQFHIDNSIKIDGRVIDSTKHW